MPQVLAKKMKQKGFTLIELLVVVAIIGILAAVGVVAYNGYTASAKKSASKSNASALCKIVKAELTKASINGANTKIFNGAYTYTGSLSREENAIASAIAKGYKEVFKSPYGPQSMPNSPSNLTSLGVFVGNGTSDHLNKNFAGINLTTGGNANKTTINTCTNQADCANNIFTCTINFSDY